MIVLGIETSFDETAAAVVKDGEELLSNAVFSSMDLHKVYGGVVPEIAARSHIESMHPVIDQALTQAFQGQTLKQCWEQIDAIAVTYGAGLGGSLLVGVMTARTLAITKNKPLYGINHVEAHVYANFLIESKKERRLENGDWRIGNQTYQLPEKQPEFPILALIVSGGHSQLALFRGYFDYTLLGQTRDDAIGEAFDKVAKMVGLPYPGGPSIAKAAKSGNPTKYRLPKARLEGESEALLELRARNLGLGEKQSAQKSKFEAQSSKNHNYDFSFSGPKTAVLRLAQELIGEDYTFPSHQLPRRLSESQRNDIAASFQRVAVETVVDKTILAYEEFQPKSVVIAGGVAANQELRHQLSQRLEETIARNLKSEARNTETNSKPEKRKKNDEKLTKEETRNSKRVNEILHFTDIKLCTDNGAMIATLGCYKAILNQPTSNPYELEISPNLSM